LNGDERTLLPKAEAVPYFQPIVSLQNQGIFGYESLGRRVRPGRVESLGPFFHDPRVGTEMQLYIDRHLREQSMLKLASANHAAALFINVKPSWIFKAYKENRMLPTIQLIRKIGIDPSRVVIEITEEEFNGRLEDLMAIVELYRQEGCTVAIDDIGSGFSNFDRIAMLQPKIMKIDLNILKKSDKHTGYKALLQSFSVLSAQMGASLLVEGVETKSDLQNALRAGARYAQGYLFSQAEPDFQQPDVYKMMLKEEMRLYSESEFERCRRLTDLQTSLGHLTDASRPIATAEDADGVIEQVARTVTASAIRMFICRGDGYQISSNYYRRGEIWCKDPGFRGSNWIWRPYFIANIHLMHTHSQGILSQTYTDLDSSSLIQTYSCSLGGGHYLFLDLAT